MKKILSATGLAAFALSTVLMTGCSESKEAAIITEDTTDIQAEMAAAQEKYAKQMSAEAEE